MNSASVATGNPQRDKDVSPECRTADQAGALTVISRPGLDMRRTEVIDMVVCVSPEWLFRSCGTAPIVAIS